MNRKPFTLKVEPFVVGINRKLYPSDFGLEEWPDDWQVGIRKGYSVKVISVDPIRKTITVRTDVTKSSK